MRIARWVAADARTLEGPGPRDAQGFARVDLLIDEGRIAALAPSGARDFGETPRLPLSGRIALPCFVDAHTHLDKGHIWRRAPNPNGDFPSAIQAVMADRAAHWSAPDVAARMEFGLACAYAHGTRAIRTHLDSVGGQSLVSFPVFAAARERWKGRIDLQASPLFGVDFTFEPGHLETVAQMVETHGSRLLGAVTYMIPRLREALATLFDLAERKGWDLDFHVDETADPEARSLEAIADVALERRFRGADFGGALLLAGAAGRGHAHSHRREGGARAARRGVAADVQPVSSGPPRRPHAALARRHGAARAESRRGRDDDRQRQYARPVFTLMATST